MRTERWLFVVILILPSLGRAHAEDLHGIPRHRGDLYDFDQVKPIGLPEGWCGTIPYSPEDVPNTRIHPLGSAKDFQDCWECGEPVEYESWAHDQCMLRRFKGLYVQLLVPEDWLENPAFTPEVRRQLVDGADWLYQYYRDLVGKEPAGEGLLTIAVVPQTCGWGCGIIGCKGIEIGNDDECCAGSGNRSIWREAELGRINNLIVHEMAHNFDVFNGYVDYGDDKFHHWTDLINIDFFVRSRFGTGRFSSFRQELSPGEFQEYLFNWSLWPYLNLDGHSWEKCVEQAGCKESGISPKEIRSMWLHRLTWRYGPEVMDRFLEEIRSYAATHEAPSTDQDKEDLFIESLATAARVDLVPCVDRLDWSLSAAARSRISSEFDPDGFCVDEDGDGQTPFEGDCNDSDAVVHRGAVELVNGKDDNCDGVVDELLTDFGADKIPPTFTAGSADPSTKVSFPIPVTIRGNTDATDWFWLETDIPDDTRLKVKLCSEGEGFEGWGVVFSHYHGKYPFGVWTGAGKCGIFHPEYATSDHLSFAIDPSHTGRWSLHISQAGDWNWQNAGAQVDVLEKLSGKLTFTYKTVDPSVFLIRPDTIRFWVFRHGWVGSAPYSETASIEWTPPAPLTSGTYGVRAQAFVGSLPVSPVTDVTWFDVADDLKDPFERITVVPAAARTEGIGGTTWVSDLVLHNTGKSIVNARLSFLRQGYSNEGASLKVVPVSPGRSVRLNDVVGTFFGEHEAVGAIRITSRNPVIVTSRTYNDDQTGTYGQFIPGFPQDRELHTGDRLLLLQLVSNPRFRSALGAVNLSTVTAVIRFDVYDSDGRILGTHEETLSPYAAIQINRAIRCLGTGAVDTAYAVASMVEGDGGVYPYASVVDNASGDPIFIRPSKVSSDTSYVPAAAHVSGSNDTLWRSDLVVVNLGEEEAHYSIQLLEAGRDNTVYREQTFELDGGKAVRYGDVLEELFDFTGSAALRIVPDSGEIAVACRTYNDNEAGTYGQSIPGVGLTSALAGGQEGRLVQLAYSGDRSRGYRTNIGFLNPTAGSTTLTIRFHAGDGELLGSRDVDLRPYSFRQINDVFRTVGSVFLEDAYVVVSPDASMARLFAYASVVDNQSGDPIYLPVVPGVASPVTFSDPELERCTRSFVGIKEPLPVFPEDVAELTQFTCWGYPIRTLDGLEHFKKLERLVVEFGQVQDISAVASLIRLREVSFESNQLIDLSPIDSLSDLRMLDIRRNRVNDLSPVARLEKLIQLWAYSNEIISVEPLSALARLRDAELDWNYIEELGPLVENESFANYLNVNGNNLDEDDCPEIKTLENRGTRIEYSEQRDGELVCETR